MTDDLAQFCTMNDDRFAVAIEQLWNAIEQNDPKTDRKIGKMMSSDAILYCQQDIMKYAITCHAKHISLHLMPIYCYAEIHAKFKSLIKAGKFQKGCVNFTDLENLPIEDIGLMIADCAAKDYPTAYQLKRKK